MGDVNSLLSDIEALGATDTTPLAWNELATADQSNAPLSLLEKVAGYSRSYLAGPTFGYADNLEALISSVIGGKDYNQELATIQGQQQRFKDKTDYLDNIVEIASGAALNPIGAIGNTKYLSSTPILGLAKKVLTSVPAQAVYSTMGAANGEATIEDVGKAAAMGTAASMLSSVVGNTLQKTAINKDRLKLSAYGIGNADIARQFKKLGDEAVDIGDSTQIPIVKTLAKAENNKLINAGNDILENAKNIDSAQNVIGGKVSNILKEADNAIPNDPSFGLDNTIKYIEKLSGTSRTAANSAAMEEIDALTRQIRTGSLEELQRAKTGLNYKYDQNPYKDDIIKAIRSDLRAEIEKRVDNAATKGLINSKNAGQVKKLNQEWGDYAELKDAFLRKAGRTLQGDIIEDTIGGLKTSGGTGSLNIASATTGNPLWAWLGAGLNAARVPEAKSALADVIGDPAIGKPMELLGKVLPEISSGRNVSPQLLSTLYWMKLKV